MLQDHTNRIYTIIFCSITFATSCMQATNPDDLAKNMNRLNINTSSRPAQTAAHQDDREPIHSEQSHDYGFTILHYAGGDWKKIYLIGPQQIIESYTHRTGQTTREIVELRNDA